MPLTEHQQVDLDGLTEGLVAGTLNMEGLMRLAFLTSSRSGWYDKEPQSFGEFCALMHSEVSEAFEAYRDTGDEKKTWLTVDGKHEEGSSVRVATKPEGAWTEIADVFIRAFDRAQYQGVDLYGLICQKMAYNLTRSYRHGGKVI